jgi:hypothetical protein
MLRCRSDPTTGSADRRAREAGEVARSSLRRRLQLSAGRMAAWRPTGADLRDLIRSTATSFVALGVTVWLLPDVHAGGPGSVLVLVVIVAAVGTLLRPPLVGLAALLGSVGLLLAGILSQAIILDIALAAAPNGNSGGFANVLLASWVAAAIAALINWLFDAGTADAFLSQVLGRAVRVSHRHGDIAGPGMLVIQIDGLGEPVMRQAITAGNMPQLAGWLRRGTHRLTSWHTGVPATTPAGQAALLHGDVTQIPSFRWYEKDSGRLIVANRPADAALIERRISTGRGLLADGGVSVSNLFSGDAPTDLLTMSDARLPPRRTRGLATFAASPAGLIRSMVLFVGQMLTEIQQGRRQRRRDVQPRVSRRGWFILLRAVTTVFLRDLNVAIVAEQMARGAPVIYVDFLDYDELAHHAGPTRPESMRTLDGLDRILRLFAMVAGEVGRRYEIVVLSDHGQAQGATFKQLAGGTLREVVESLCGATPQPLPGREDMDAAPAERWGPANLLLTGVTRAESMAGGAARTLLRGKTAQHDDGPAVTLGRGQHPTHSGPMPIVAAAGSLAHVYFPDLPGRALLADIESLHPHLLCGLAEHPQIGCAVVRSADGLLVLGSTGWRVLSATPIAGNGLAEEAAADTGMPLLGEGADPLAPYGPRAGADIVALDAKAHVGDIILLGRFDPATGEVTAFEELVGSHGGLGGGQTEGVLVCPSGWRLPPAEQSAHADADAGGLSGLQLHAVLIDRLRALGLRADAPAEAGAPAAPAASAGAER